MAVDYGTAWPLNMAQLAVSGDNLQGGAAGLRAVIIAYGVIGLIATTDVTVSIELQSHLH